MHLFNQKKRNNAKYFCGLVKKWINSQRILAGIRSNLFFTNLVDNNSPFFVEKIFLQDRRKIFQHMQRYFAYLFKECSQSGISILARKLHFIILKYSDNLESIVCCNNLLFSYNMFTLGYLKTDEMLSYYFGD